MHRVSELGRTCINACIVNSAVLTRECPCKLAAPDELKRSMLPQVFTGRLEGTLTSSERCGAGKTGNGCPTMKDRAHDEAMAELLRGDPAFATQLLNDVLEEGEQADLLIALRQMVQAFGGVSMIAEKAHLNPTRLYRMLSPEGNPELRSLTAVLKAMGMRFSIQPLRRE